MVKRIAVCAAALVLFAGCGGGGGGTGVPGPVATPQPTGTPAGPQTAVSLAITIPAPLSPSARARSPRYVSPATAQIRVAVNGGTPQTFTAGAGAACPAGTIPASGTCTVYSVQAPAGTDTFTVTLLDGTGHVLSQGSTTVTIVANTTNTVSIVFDGVAASVAVVLTNATPPAGAAARIGVSLAPLDARDFTLVGAPGTLPAITVTDSDTSGATALYLAGSSGGCDTSSGTPSASVTVTQSGTGYPRVCLQYDGRSLPGGATLTATIAGGITGTATLRPVSSSSSPSGVWVYGTLEPNPAVRALERVDANLNVVTIISGSNASFSDNEIGVGSDAAGNVYVLQLAVGGALQMLTFPPTAFGNVAPSSVATYTTNLGDPPSPGAGAETQRFAVDPAGHAYVLRFTNGSDCAILALPPGGGTPPAIADCTSMALAHRDGVNGPYFAADAQGVLYLALTKATASSAAPSDFYRFTVNANGTATPLSAVTLAQTVAGQLTFDPNGNVVTSVGSRPYQISAIDEIPLSAFVDGTTSTVTPSPVEPFGEQVFAEDGAGNVFVGFVGSSSPSPTLRVFPAGSQILTQATSSFVPFNAAPVRAVVAPNTSGSMTASPSYVQLPGQSQTTVSEPGYTGQFVETDTCGTLATVSPSSANGPSGVFTVTAGSSGGGMCGATFHDSGGRTVSVQIGVTATVITGSGRRRRP
jgi:hypothetical protein